MIHQSAPDWIFRFLFRRLLLEPVGEGKLWQGRTRLLAVFDGNDDLILRFRYADGRMPLSFTKGGTDYSLSYDQVGTLRTVTDASGAVVKELDFDSFGNLIGDTNPGFYVPFAFAGGLQDPDTGLVRFGFRDYDPEVGRWTAKDPIGFGGGDTNLYGYCLNDPVGLYDEEGLLPPVGYAVVVMGTAFAIWFINWWYDATHPTPCSDKLNPGGKNPGYPQSPGMPRYFQPSQYIPPNTPQRGK